MNIPTNPAQPKLDVRKRNIRMALILGSVAVVFFIGFIAKYVLLSR